MANPLRRNYFLKFATRLLQTFYNMPKRGYVYDVIAERLRCNRNVFTM